VSVWPARFHLTHNRQQRCAKQLGFEIHSASRQQMMGSTVDVLAARRRYTEVTWAQCQKCQKMTLVLILGSQKIACYVVGCGATPLRSVLIFAQMSAGWATWKFMRGLLAAALTSLQVIVVVCRKTRGCIGTKCAENYYKQHNKFSFLNCNQHFGNSKS